MNDRITHNSIKSNSILKAIESLYKSNDSMPQKNFRETIELLFLPH